MPRNRERAPHGLERALWLSRVRQAWSRRSVVWLSGVRRAGKTTLARMLPDAAYVNCDLPSAARAADDPELFLGGRAAGSILVLDEVQRLSDPSRLLKIAADVFPQLRILATGSSTLAATTKFRDTLAGRKAGVHLVPVLWEECADPFGVPDFDRRLLHGGLPEPLLASRKDPRSSASGSTASTRATSWSCSVSGTAGDSCRSFGCCCAGARGRSTTAGWRV